MRAHFVPLFLQHFNDPFCKREVLIPSCNGELLETVGSDTVSQKHIKGSFLLMESQAQDDDAIERLVID